MNREELIAKAEKDFETQEELEKDISLGVAKVCWHCKEAFKGYFYQCIYHKQVFCPECAEFEGKQNYIDAPKCLRQITTINFYKAYTIKNARNCVWQKRLL